MNLDGDGLVAAKGEGGEIGRQLQVVTLGRDRVRKAVLQGFVGA